MFTTHQYDKAIEALQLGRQQLEPDGRNCMICGDGDHQAWECHHNPLRAMRLLMVIHQQSHELHDSLHHLCGYDNPGLGAGFVAAVPDAEPEVTSA